MVITDFLERNARLYGSEIALVEINPSEDRDRASTWREANLVEAASPDAPYRRELTWQEFDRRANRFANPAAQPGNETGNESRYSDDELSGIPADLFRYSESRLPCGPDELPLCIR